MKLLLDQGLPRTAATLLSQAGLDTLHVGDIEMSDDIIRRASTEGRVVVTLDADFHTLLALDAATSPSVIRIRIERLRAQAVTKLLLAVVAECQRELEQGAAVTVEPSRIRIRLLPLVADAK